MEVGPEMKKMDLLQVQSYLKDDDGFLPKKHTYRIHQLVCFNGTETVAS